MKQPNGYGSVTKLTGNRRKPYMVRITTGKVYNEETKKAYCERKVLGYYRTRAEALSALGAYNTKPYNLDSNSITLTEVWDMIKDTVNVSDNRKKVYRTVFDTYLSDISKMKMSEIKTVHLKKIFDDCEHGYSTQSNIRSVLNRIYSYSMENDIVNKNYMDYIKLESEETMIQREIYTDEEIAAFWENKHIPDYAFTLVLLHQGMRITELVDAMKEDVDLVNNTISIKKGKNKFSIRTIPINEHIKDILESQMKLPGLRLFDMNYRHYRYFVEQNLKHKPYDSRHTFASKLNKKKERLVVIKKLMGHKPKSVVEQHYIHLTMEELQESINKVCYQPVTN